jgi:TolA-binding protein
MRRWTSALAGLAIAVTALPAAAQVQSREAIALQNQILELRHDLQVLQDQLATAPRGSFLASPPPPPAARAPGSDILTGLLDRISQLEDEVRQIRGKVDENSNELQRQNDDLTKQIADLAFRVQTLEGGGSGAPPPPGGSTGGSTLGARPAGGTPPSSLSPPPRALGTIPAPPPPPSDANASPPPRTPELAMQQGNAALARRDYATAEASAREVLATHGPRTYDAQFLLAQALTGKRDYQQAALAYDDTYNRAKTGPRAADSLLGLSNALAMIGEKRASCETLSKLQTQFPNLRADQRDAVTAIRLRSGCA